MVLVVVHSVGAGERMLAAANAVEGVPGVQVVFTQPPGPSDDRVADFLTAADALITPWERAAHERFDLVIAASPTGVGRLQGALLLLPEVSTDGEVVDHNGRRCLPSLSGLFRQRVEHPDAMVIGLPHSTAVASLQSTSPEIGRHATVVGDPVYDHLLDALSHRNAHRDRLGVQQDQRLGLVVSTRGPESLLGRSPALLGRIATDLPASGDRLICHLHPDVWVRHGRRQVLAWAGPAARSHVRFLRLGQGWQVPVAAADYVIGDHGLLTAYAAAAGKPVYLANPLPNTAPCSLGEAVARYGTPLDPAVPLGTQINWTARPSSPVAQLVTSAPSRSADLLRAGCLRLLRITDSARQAVADT
ncbi:hypothetical protein N8J89_14045 [Crossiella sp. CA-258035]|uniref:hypothetical protein n=1 Tax=Crossiella sp. CA-258035 TaxID=2981138 RepID=UPI0024BCE8E8|nr:hypothetical protein [Crossiella sp. CA-258035]WHT22137.1 hypothetical protein N8J89_14045 [Crossiella sp. CA-258035]